MTNLLDEDDIRLQFALDVMVHRSHVFANKGASGFEQIFGRFAA